MLSTGAPGEDDITLDAILSQWVLVEYDFQHVLNIDLDAVRHTLSWRRFVILLAGLFGTENSLLRHHFKPDPDPGTQNPTTMEDA